MPALMGPAIVVVIAILLLVLVWRLAREGRRRFEYWKGVLGVWKRNRERDRT